MSYLTEKQLRECNQLSLELNYIHPSKLCLARDLLFHERTREDPEEEMRVC